MKLTIVTLRLFVFWFVFACFFLVYKKTLAMTDNKSKNSRLNNEVELMFVVISD